jgi:hypothetical protein
MMHEGLSDIQFQILDAIYFPEPIVNILEETDATLPVVINELRSMIDKGWVQVMEFDAQRNDYIRTAIYDTDHMEAYRFLATKAGLLKHNGH